ncbi:hypothetical protein [Leptolyngbya sp. Heron Island J]|uniref:hypothetical protein n=1 Tax=Leptolyngbya sp. Heron Island J TaxID=1385935 RepID=UPI0003F76393|nr:hypothetical protein [Leptolyngbya sp. Heron Island J]
MSAVFVLGTADPRDDFSCETSSNSNGSRAVHPLAELALVVLLGQHLRDRT